MNFLTLDSSSQRLMVAVKAKSKEAGVILNSVGKHGAFLITAMQDLLTYGGLNPSELDFVGCGIGPGS
ncbi:MAG: tRNA (adenosine(37)-N6)-threonylcarbamoyltransferase complex dimerization subunit type 1 TsaB, partial [Thermotogae bacterium]